MRRVTRLALAAASLVTVATSLGALACSGAVDLGSNAGDSGTLDANAPSDGGAATDAATLNADADAGAVTPGAACGSRGLPPCAAGLFCRFDVAAQCGATDQPGTCVTPPAVCGQENAPVCGCDVVTYTNECVGASAGASVRHVGTCVPGDNAPDGGACGSRGLPPCASAEVCIFPLSSACGATDLGGTCRPRSLLRACAAVIDPVCGCDGTTYNNECAANNANTSARKKGGC